MQCYEYLGAKNQCDLKIIQLPLTRIKWKLLRCINIYIYIYGTHECKGMANEHLRWFTTIIHNYIYHTHLFIYKDMFLLVFSIASIQSNNQLYRSSLPSPHVFPIARSPELIVVIPKTSNTSCSVRETFDILFIGDMNFIAVGPEQHGQGQGVPVWWHILRLQHAREMMGGHILNHDESCVGFRSSAFFAELDLVMPWWGMIAQSWTVL